jgi:ribonucleotide reductase alpha subunit
MMLRTLSYFVCNQQTPHIVLPIATFNTEIKPFINLIKDNAKGNKKFEEFMKKYKHGDYYDKISVLISEWANGGDLLDYIRANYKTISLKEWRVMFFQILSSLAVIHKKYPSFRHNDMKANNILLHISDNKSNETKYGQGIFPIDTYKKEVDELAVPQYRFDWGLLADEARTYGIRNSTLMALMPSETSAQISNATNGIEPPRSLVSVKQSKDGVLKQVVPEVRKLKKKYDLLWDQKSPEGYLKIVAVLQKFIDQGISVNTSYNPKFYEDEKIPMSEMIGHLLMFYKYGGKQLYYFNTNDGAGEYDEVSPLRIGDIVQEEDCEACKI